MNTIPLHGNAAVLKKINRTRLLNKLWHAGSCSRTSLAGITGLDKKTITNICNSLYKDGLISIRDTKTSGKGRPPQLIALNPYAAYSIGVDVGGGHVSAVLMDFTGSIKESFTYILKPERQESVWTIIEDTVVSLLNGFDGEKSLIKGVGICIPGLLDYSTGSVVRSVNLRELEGVDVTERLAEKIGLPVFLEESTRSIALAEIWFGGRSGLNDFIVADLGVGIGLGIIHDGKLHRGAHGSSGEIGHLVVQPGGKKCTCGKSGCLETVASGKALEESNYSENSVSEAGAYVGMALANAANILDPGEIILQGGLVKLGELFLNPLVESAARHSLAGTDIVSRIRTSELGDMAGAMGVGMLPVRGYFEMENIRI